MQNEENSLSLFPEYVLDSFALLAFLGAEKGCAQVQELLEAAKAGKCRLYMCVINLGEVLYIVERERGLPRAQETLASLSQLPIEMINVDLALTLSAAHLKSLCPIAYADCFAAALSKLKNAVLVSGDPEFKQIKAKVNLRVEWLDQP